jgi:hypothetical protein
VNIPPNSLGRVDKHKIGFAHQQLHPSMIGVVDLLDSSKDVGQTGMISPWADISDLSNADINKYPTVKFELYKYIENHFPIALRFNANNIVEYNRMLDKLVVSAYINLDYKVTSETVEE